MKCVSVTYICLGFVYVCQVKETSVKNLATIECYTLKFDTCQSSSKTRNEKLVPKMKS